MKKQKYAPKMIKIDATNSIMEGNLIELPFIYYSKTKEKPVLVQYTWTNSAGKKCTIEVAGHPKYGVPTPYEFDVLLALFRIRAKQRPIPYGKEFLLDDEISVEDLLVHFSQNDVAKELNKTNTGAILARIKKSIQILAHTTITSTESEVLYDPVTKKHITTESGNISHIIDDIKWKSTRTKNKTSDKHTAKIGEFFFKSISNSYFKYYDYECYCSLGNNNIAKRMYLVLDKWRNNKTTQVLKLQTLYDHIPLDDSKENYRKNEVIKKAAKALEGVDFIKSFKIIGDKIEFVYAGEKAIAATQQNLLEKYNFFTDIQQRFKEHGFTEEEWNGCVNYIVINLPYVKALLRYIDDAGLKTPKRYIMKGLNLEQHKIDKKYYNPGEIKED